MNLKLEPGYCWLSGKACFEITETYAHDHLLAGHVLRVGKPYPFAYKVDLLLIDGSHADITIHECCIDEVKDRLNELWHLIVERTTWEFSKRDILGVKYRSDAQKKTAMNCIIRQTLNNPPIGVLAIQKWSEVFHKIRVNRL